MTMTELRSRARELFPQWSRRMRAKWVLARATYHTPRTRLSNAVDFDIRHYKFARELK